MYIIIDPWKVIWNYDNYTDIKVNAGYRSYKLLTQQDSIPYNSFIVGSSRSQQYPIQEWECLLADSDAVGFHFDQSGDCAYGALERLENLYTRVSEVRHVLLIIDHDFLNGITPPTGAQFCTPWQMTKENDFFKFQLTCYQFLFSKNGLELLLDFGEVKTLLPYYFDERNEPHLVGKEWALMCDPEYYYSHLILQDVYKLYPRDTVEQIGETIITSKCIELLSRMQNLFETNHTEYKVVVSPLFDQIKLNPLDKNILDSIFGDENVFDYSGINIFTKDTTNYYENSHYRPKLAKSIMRDVYK
jgi:hypothetical protein